ncbi:MAG: hypothetical protein ABI690_26440 [Chloroflexota bacterium]
MRRGSIFVILFILVAAVIVGASQFMRSQPPTEYTIAVDPLAVPWVEDAVKSLNASGPLVNGTQRIQFKVTPIDDLDVWQGQPAWTASSHPVAWIPASSLSISFAADNGVPVISVTNSLARTPLVWGGYVSRVDVLTNKGAQPLDWPVVEAAAAKESWSKIAGPPEWQFIKIGFGQPNKKIGGLVALFTGAATRAQNERLTAGSVGADPFRTWMKPVIQALPSLSGDPVAAMARGPSTVEIGLFPESQWLLNLSGLVKNEDVRFNYPAYQLILDFPLARWDDNSTTTPEQRAAVDMLSDWLSAAAQQAKAPDYGLRPAASEPTDANKLFAAGVPYGIQLTPNFGTTVTPPSRSDVLGLIQWVNVN